MELTLLEDEEYLFEVVGKKCVMFSPTGVSPLTVSMMSSTVHLTGNYIGGSASGSAAKYC